MIVRSKVEAVYNRSGHTAKISPQCVSLEFNPRTGKFRPIIQDYYVKPSNTETEGAPLFNYHPVPGGRRDDLYYSKEQISALFDAVGVAIVPGDTEVRFGEEFAKMIPMAIMNETTGDTLYGLTGADFELVDETTEVYIAPEPAV